MVFFIKKENDNKEILSFLSNDLIHEEAKQRGRISMRTLPLLRENY